MTIALFGGQRKIGTGHPCFIIAEAGVNHNGELRLAKQLIDAAKNAGADAVKFQNWITEEVVTPDSLSPDYFVHNTKNQENLFAQLKRWEFTGEQFAELQAHSESRDLPFFSSPDEEASADLLRKLNVPVIKVGSAEVTNLPLLRHIAGMGRPVILSTGMSSLGDVEAAVGAMEGAGNRQIVLLHCVSSYPADPSECNLRAMDVLASQFPYPIGFSDHTLGISVSLAAVARGACVIEKHLTLDKSLPGPDQALSLTPEEFHALVQSIRTVESSLGDGRKRVMKSEMSTQKAVVKTWVFASPVGAGRRIRLDDLVLRKMGRGLPHGSLPMLIGRRVTRDCAKNEVLTLEVLE